MLPLQQRSLNTKRTQEKNDFPCPHILISCPHVFFHIHCHHGVTLCYLGDPQFTWSGIYSSFLEGKKWRNHSSKSGFILESQRKLTCCWDSREIFKSMNGLKLVRFVKSWRPWSIEWQHYGKRFKTEQTHWFPGRDATLTIEENY